MSRVRVLTDHVQIIEVQAESASELFLALAVKAREAEEGEGYVINATIDYGSEISESDWTAYLYVGDFFE